MALCIQPAGTASTIPPLTVLLIGQPGTGKTSLACASRSPLILDFDRGMHRSAFSSRAARVPVTCWADVAQIEPKDLAGHDVVVVDTVGRLLDALSKDLMAHDAKLRQRDGSLSLKGFGALKARFTAWLSTLRSSGAHVVLLAHAVEREEGDLVKIRPDVVGSSKAELYYVADVVGVLEMEGKDRALRLEPSDRYLSKSPAMTDRKVPDLATAPHYLADLIGEAQRNLEGFQAEARAMADQVLEWGDRVAQADSAEAINALVAESQTIQADLVAGPVKRAIHTRATSLGLVYTKGQGYHAEEAA